jgi:DNA-binding transcriptional LysR family regulator
MRLDWLEDLVALIESGSFNEAAARRFVTQPAFSRRIRAIEEYIGVELFDRDRKPAALKPTTSVHQEDIKRLVAQTKELIHELRRQSRESFNRIVVASQHSLTATLVPNIVQSLSERMDASVRLRSANRDECHALLMTKQADLLINYLSSSEAAASAERFVERTIMGTELFIPVSAPSKLENWLEQDELPIVAYPNDAFFGRIFNEEVLPQMPRPEFVRRKVETALTFAALELAINGVGVAWVPESLARGPVGLGQLCNLAGALPSAPLTLAALRLAGPHSPAEEFVWSEVLARQ